MFIDTLIEKIREKDNPSVVGLDPRDDINSALRDRK